MSGGKDQSILRICLVRIEWLSACGGAAKCDDADDTGQQEEHGARLCGVGAGTRRGGGSVTDQREGQHRAHQEKGRDEKR
jgi:hypothetical protein